MRISTISGSSCCNPAMDMNSPGNSEGISPPEGQHPRAGRARTPNRSGLTSRVNFFEQVWLSPDRCPSAEAPPDSADDPADEMEGTQHLEQSIAVQTVSQVSLAHSDGLSQADRCQSQAEASEDPDLSDSTADRSDASGDADASEDADASDDADDHFSESKVSTSVRKSYSGSKTPHDSSQPDEDNSGSSHQPTMGVQNSGSKTSPDPSRPEAGAEHSESGRAALPIRTQPFRTRISVTKFTLEGKQDHNGSIPWRMGLRPVSRRDETDEVCIAPAHPTPTSALSKYQEWRHRRLSSRSQTTSDAAPAASVAPWRIRRATTDGSGQHSVPEAAGVRRTSQPVWYSEYCGASLASTASRMATDFQTHYDFHIAIIKGLLIKLQLFIIFNY